MKNYLTPLAILVGSIIITVGIYLAITSNDRARFNYCMEQNSKKYPKASKKEVKELCVSINFLRD